MTKKAALFISIIILLTSCKTYPPSFKANHDIVTHQNSKTRFPAKIGELDRDDKYITQYDTKGLDISVGYNQLRPYNITLTQYIYTSYSEETWISPEQHIADLSRTIAEYYKTAELIEQGRVKQGHYTLHKLTGTEELYTYTILYLIKKWFVKLRITFPIGQKSEAEVIIKKYISNMPAPEKEIEINNST